MVSAQSHRVELHLWNSLPKSVPLSKKSLDKAVFPRTPRLCTAAASAGSPCLAVGARGQRLPRLLPSPAAQARVPFPRVCLSVVESHLLTLPGQRQQRGLLL